MDLAAYQKSAMRTSDSQHDRVKNGALGLIGETGEIVDIIKKYLFQSGKNAPLPVDDLKKECGDVMWYIAETCTGLGVNMQTVMDHIHTGGCAPADMEACAITMMECALYIYHRMSVANAKLMLMRVLADLYLHLVMLCNYAYLPVHEVAEANIKKLEKRYPAGFDPERSLHRPEYAQKEAEAHARPAEDMV